MDQQTNECYDETITTDYINKLIKDLTSEDEKKSESAHLCLLTFSEQAIGPLTEALNNLNQRIRWEAAKTLVEMRNPALAPVLIEGLESNDGDIRWLSAAGLISLGKKGLAPLLKVLISKSTSAWLRQGARHIISDLYERSPHSGEKKYMTIHDLSYGLREKLEPVLRALDDSEASLKAPIAAQAALDYIRETGD